MEKMKKTIPLFIIIIPHAIVGQSQSETRDIRAAWLYTFFSYRASFFYLTPYISTL